MANPFKISWTAPEFSHTPKGVSWFWMSIILAIIILAVSIWQKNFLFSIFIVIAEVLILKWGDKAPEIVKFSLTEKGLTIGEEKFYPLSEFKSFNIEKDEYADSDSIDINLFFQAKMRPALRLQAPKEESHNIEQALSLVLPKVEWEPSFLETIEKLLKF